MLGVEEGRFVLRAGTTRGFTLVELMVGITIVGIAIAMGMPGFTTYLQGSKLANSAHSYLSGLQLARAEAIRRNVPVQFILTSDPITPTIQNTAVLNAAGQNWVVRFLDPTGLTPPFTLIQAKSAQEGAYSSAGVSSVLVAGSASSITFNGFGATGVAYQLNLSNPNGGACAPAGPMRCPRVQVTAGGQVSVCDPTVTVLGDSRGC
jgi:type IV fimbrial biogenesis protein FimT